MLGFVCVTAAAVQVQSRSKGQQTASTDIRQLQNGRLINVTIIADVNELDCYC